VNEREQPAGGLARRLAAEGVGTALLPAAIVGSGVMGERLAGGSAGLALLANTLATAAAPGVLILTLRPVSGGRVNPAVSLADAATGALPRSDAGSCVAA